MNLIEFISKHINTVNNPILTLLNLTFKDQEFFPFKIAYYFVFKWNQQKYVKNFKNISDKYGFKFIKSLLNIGWYFIWSSLIILFKMSKLLV